MACNLLPPTSPHYQSPTEQLNNLQTHPYTKDCSTSLFHNRDCLCSHRGTSIIRQCSGQSTPVRPSVFPNNLTDGFPDRYKKYLLTILIAGPRYRTIRISHQYPANTFLRHSKALIRIAQRIPLTCGGNTASMSLITGDLL